MRPSLSSFHAASVVLALLAGSQIAAERRAWARAIRSARSISPARATVVAALLLAVAAVAPGPAAASTFWVTNSNDAGPGSFRQAIVDAELNAGVDQILFSIPGSGVHTIRLLSELYIEHAVTIDGSSQGPPDRHLIEIDGSAVPSGRGLVTQLEGSVIQHLVLHGFQLYAVVFLSDGNYLADCLIGTDASGEVEIGNGTGVGVSSSANWIVSNTISGNTTGIFMQGSSNVVERNFLGPNRSGQPFALTGTVSQQSSLFLYASDKNDIRLNTIGASSYAVAMLQSHGNRVVGNSIGVAADGKTPLGSPYIGVLLDQSSRNLINANRVAHVGWGWTPPTAAIWVASGAGNTIRENLAYDIASGGLAIDLETLGSDANDPNDADQGANDLQNWPVLRDALTDATGTVVRGEFKGAPATRLTIDFYATTRASPSGTCEARLHLGTATVLTDASGFAPFTFSIPLFLDPGTLVSASATHLRGRIQGSTSETSPCIAVR